MSSTGSIKCTLSGATGPFNITYKVGDNYYGYHIGANGYIFKLIKGLLPPSHFGLARIGTKIEVKIDGNTLSILENGVNNGHYITVPDEDKGKPVYGSILFDTGNITLTECTIEGFTEKLKGQTVELSYIDGRASEFKNYTNKNSYLLIDRSGAGDFSSGDIEYHKITGTDAGRSKLLFDNIFWDTDGNAKDVFTFAYRPHDIFAELTVRNPDCDEQDYEAENGSIRILMKEGLRGYTYTLTDTSTKNTVKSGSFYKNDYTIDSLPSGIYDLTIQEKGGSLLKQDGISNTLSHAISTSSFSSLNKAYLEWTLAEENLQASVGFMTSSTTITSMPSAVTFKYGIYMDGFNLYLIENNEKSSSLLTRIKGGDRIKLELNGSNNLTVYINDQSIQSKTISISNQVYGAIKIETKGGEILNQQGNQFPLGTGWRVSDNMQVSKSSQAKLTGQVELASGCAPAPKVSPGDEATQSDNALITYLENSGDYRAVVKLKEPDTSATTLMIFNLSGTLVEKRELPTGIPAQGVVFNLPGTGVYIIKAITDTKEYSGKLLAN